MRPDWRGYQLSIGALTDISAGGPGVFAPFGIEFAGPPALRDRVELVTIETQNGSGRSYRLVEWHGRSMLCHGLYDNPSVFLALDHSVLIEPIELQVDENDGTWQMVQGFARGFLLDTPAGIFDGVVQIGRAAWHIIRNYNSVAIIWRFVQGEGCFHKDDRERIAAAGQLMDVLTSLAAEFIYGNAGVRLAIAVGADARLYGYGSEYRLAGLLAIELWEAMLDATAEMSAYDIGRAFGRAAGEACAFVISLATGTELARVTAIPAIVSRLRAVPFIAERPALVHALDRAAERVAAIGAEAAGLDGRARIETETILSLYRRIREAGGPGDNAAAALRQALDEFSAAAGRSADADSITRLINTAMREYYEHPPRLPNGEIDFEKLSYGHLKQLLEGRLRANGLVTHHVVPKYLYDELYRAVFGRKPTPAELEEIPAMFLHAADHQGAGQGTASIHRLIGQRLGYRQTPVGQERAVPEVIRALRRSYGEFGRSDAWMIAESWLQSKGIPVPPLP